MAHRQSNTSLPGRTRGLCASETGECAFIILLMVSGTNKLQTSGAQPERAVPGVEQPDFPTGSQENASPDTTKSDKDDAGETKLEGPDAWKTDPEPLDPEKTET